MRRPWDIEITYARKGEANITVRPAGELTRMLGEQVKPCKYKPKPKLREVLAEALEADPDSLVVYNECPEEIGLEGWHVGDHACVRYESALCPWCGV